MVELACGRNVLCAVEAPGFSPARIRVLPTALATAVGMGSGAKALVLKPLLRHG